MMSKSNVVYIHGYESNRQECIDKCMKYEDRVHFTPQDLILQNHLKNLQSVFTNTEIVEMIELLGITKININKVG